jgi:hypothetical protein
MCLKQNGEGVEGVRDFEQLKVNRKWYRKLDNVSEIRLQWPIEMATGPPASLKIERVHGKFEAEGTVHDVKRNRYGDAQRINQSFFFRWVVATIRNDHPNIRQRMCSRDRY